MVSGTLCIFLALLASVISAFPSIRSAPFPNESSNHTISPRLFAELEELARIVDITYCVGTAGSGIQKPFECLSRCSDFEGFELVTTWNTGPLLSDSCGYIALSHPPSSPRIIVAFRGTYSLANTIIDLSTVPQKYVPYPGDDGQNAQRSLSTETRPDELSSAKSAEVKSARASVLSRLTSLRGRLLKQQHNELSEAQRSVIPSSLEQRPARKANIKPHREGTEENADLFREQPPSSHPPKCDNCTVHSGFYVSWITTRRHILQPLTEALKAHPDYRLILVGHSLGGAVATLAALDFKARGWDPELTTFGEPRVGNEALMRYIDERFDLAIDDWTDESSKVRRVTHVDDPVPLLPLSEWGYRMHSGEIFIDKPELPPEPEDLRYCKGDEDPTCISDQTFSADAEARQRRAPDMVVNNGNGRIIWDFPGRYKLWELLFAHRDYFWRLGLCIPGGDPTFQSNRDLHKVPLNE